MEENTNAGEQNAEALSKVPSSEPTKPAKRTSPKGSGNNKKEETPIIEEAEDVVLATFESTSMEEIQEKAPVVKGIKKSKSKEEMDKKKLKDKEKKAKKKKREKAKKEKAKNKLKEKKAKKKASKKKK